MKIILQKPVETLGDPGDVVDVADGYARNFLIPRSMAVPATRGMVRHAESLKRSHSTKLTQRKGEYEALASRLIAAGPVSVTARAGEEGKLFGSVTAEHIAAAVAEQAGITIDRKDVHLEEPIRSVGTHEVRVHLFPDVDPVLTVEVAAQG
jgi:large subunit ribosomal protein L9